MSDSLNNSLQFIVNCVVFAASEIGKELVAKSVDYLTSLSVSSNRTRFCESIRNPDYKMFKWGSNLSGDGESTSNSGNSAKSIGDKWKSIIGRVTDEPLLDDEDVPEEEFYESSPESNKFKTLDDTLLEMEPKWRCVSDESFLKMEQMVMSPLRTPLKRITENEKEVDMSNLISFSPLILKNSNIKEGDGKIILEESSTGENEYETCDSGESRLTDIRKTREESYLTCKSEESEVSEKYLREYPLNNTLASNSDHSASAHNSDSATLSQHSGTEADESLKFNDTLEEMEHLLKYGMKYMVAGRQSESKESNDTPNKEHCFEKYCDNSKLNFNQLSSEISDLDSGFNIRGSSTSNPEYLNVPTHNVGKYRDFNEVDVASPVKKKTAKKIQKQVNTQPKESKFRLKSPRLVLPPPTYEIKSPLPKKTPTKPRKFFYDTPPPKSTPKSGITPTKSVTPSHLLTPSNHSPKYTNIMSPVQYYIKNSPVVPKIQNVSPGINLWEKQSHRAASKGRAVERPKENMAPLTEKAYQQPKSMHLIESSEQRLPKNFKVNLMAESLPKPVVIKHQRREGTTPLRENNHLTRQNTYTISGTSRESFANMDQVGGDISVCIGKPAARTHTLK